MAAKVLSDIAPKSIHSDAVRWKNALLSGLRSRAASLLNWSAVRRQMSARLSFSNVSLPL
jgi:hypothetical protein